MVKDGYRFALPPLILGIILMAFRWWWAAILVALGLFVLYFFRDPERQIPTDPGAVVSPGDGRVVEIVDEPLEGHPGKRVSIFLSVFDVHVNRAPVAEKSGKWSTIQGDSWPRGMGKRPQITSRT